MIGFRITTIVLLVVAMLSLSGIVATAELLAHAGEDIACCGSSTPEKDSDPCSVPDCPCPLCLSLDLVALPAFLKVSPAGADLSPHLQLLFLSEFISSIDYPPEIFHSILS
jgi:hypothetical protein